MPIKTLASEVLALGLDRVALMPAASVPFFNVVIGMFCRISAAMALLSTRRL